MIETLPRETTCADRERLRDPDRSSPIPGFAPATPRRSRAAICPTGMPDLPSTSHEVEPGRRRSPQRAGIGARGLGPGRPGGRPGARAGGMCAFALRGPARPEAGGDGGPGGPDEPAGSGLGIRPGAGDLPRRTDATTCARSWPGWRTRAPGSPIALVGLLAGGQPRPQARRGSRVDGRSDGLDCVIAANPPIDLAACARPCSGPRTGSTTGTSSRWLRVQVDRLHRRFPELGEPALGRVRSVYEFDDRYTAPRNGFASAEDYYARSSTAPPHPPDRAPGPGGPRGGRSVHPVRTVPADLISLGPGIRADPAGRPSGILESVALAGRAALAGRPTRHLACHAVGDLDGPIVNHTPPHATRSGTTREIADHA